MRSHITITSSIYFRSFARSHQFRFIIYCICPSANICSESSEGAEKSHRSVSIRKFANGRAIRSVPLLKKCFFSLKNRILSSMTLNSTDMSPPHHIKNSIFFSSEISDTLFTSFPFFSQRILRPPHSSHSRVILVVWYIKHILAHTAHIAVSSSTKYSLWSLRHFRRKMCRWERVNRLTVQCACVRMHEVHLVNAYERKSCRNCRSFAENTQMHQIESCCQFRIGQNLVHMC